MFKFSLWLRSIAALPWYLQIVRWAHRLGRRIVALDNLLNLLRYWLRGRNHVPLLSGLLSFIICIIILRPRCYFNGLIIAFDTGTGTAETVGLLRDHWEVSCNLYSFIERRGRVGVGTIIILLKIFLVFTFKHVFGGLPKGLLQLVLSKSIQKHLLMIKWEGRVFAVRLCKTLSLV